MDNKQKIDVEEKKAKSLSGMAMLIGILLMLILSVAVLIMAVASASILLIVLSIIIFIASFVLMPGLKILKPNEALVLTLFGQYYGTLRGAGFFFVNPFTTATNPATAETSTGSLSAERVVKAAGGDMSEAITSAKHLGRSKKVSLKTMTLNNDKQKINDQLGNPIIIGIVVIWRVVDTAKAVFNVDNYTEFLSIQCDSALRDTVRLYPYDITGHEVESEKSLRGSSQEIAANLKSEIQSKVLIAGLEIVEARITHLAYAPEIAAAMLQRQQASAVIDARQMIVDGAVGMVDMALEKLSEKNIVQLDEERKAAMVSNLLVVLCGSKDAQPVVNSGTLY